MLGLRKNHDHEIASGLWRLLWTISWMAAMLRAGAMIPLASAAMTELIECCNQGDDDDDERAQYDDHGEYATYKSEAMHEAETGEK